MADDRKRRSWFFWTVAGMQIFFIGYPLSAFPASLIFRMAGEPKWMNAFLCWFYAPVFWFVFDFLGAFHQ